MLNGQENVKGETCVCGGGGDRRFRKPNYFLRKENKIKMCLVRPN